MPTAVDQSDDPNPPVGWTFLYDLGGTGHLRFSVIHRSLAHKSMASVFSVQFYRGVEEQVA